MDALISGLNGGRPVKPDGLLASGRSSTQSPDLRSMLESHDFGGLFLFLDPIVNQVIPVDQF